MTAPITPLPATLLARLRVHLHAIYPPAQADATLARLAAMLDAFRRSHPQLVAAPEGGRVSERDALLITYGDQLREPGQASLHSLYELLVARAADVLTGVHILPFYPYTSDDGFSVVDYLAVDPALGTWEDVARFQGRFRMMYDAVINHMSASSAWFRGFLNGDERYRDYFTVVDPATDLTQVTRPRALPLLTPFETARGTEHVWTTFSADQIDLNYASPDVLLDMTAVLLHYVDQGAQLIRMDAIAYLWKEIGTRCIHLPQTHEVVQLWRTVLDATAPRTLIVSETNVPHAENISYFGDGTNEAQLVYQFPLAPLTLHAFHTQNASYLTQWAAGLQPPSDSTTFFNFLASHDGIGVRPAEGILPLAEVQKLAELATAHGGNVSYKDNPDGTRSPYELNINYFDALSDPAAGEPLAAQVSRFMAAQAILLSLQGVPGIYVHSLFGSRNWRAGVEETGRFRTINRQKWDRAAFEAELDEAGGLRQQVFGRYRDLLKARTAEAAFHPNGAQRVLDLHPALLAFVRSAPAGTNHVLCVHNASGSAVQLDADLAATFAPGAALTDLVGGGSYIVGDEGRLRVDVPPHGVLWLRGD
ncbi:MAG: sugar phosphorylase [Chloroflexales bacterium]|nr:sugar phosphorylase [Chloroflexales bacterium]